MRVITGTARGRRLKTLEGDDVRPTAERVKEGLFSAIQFDIEGRRVLDLFGGSGQLAIEALSRGAASAVIVDSSADSVAVIRENLTTVGLQHSAVILQTEAGSFLRTTSSVFDIAFVDPPYGKGLIQEMLPLLVEKMSDAGVIICEHPLTDELPQSVGGMSISRRYKYGKIMLTFYRKAVE